MHPVTVKRYHWFVLAIVVTLLTSCGRSETSETPQDEALQLAKEACTQMQQETSSDEVLSVLAKATQLDERWDSLYKAYSEWASGLWAVPATPSETTGNYWADQGARAGRIEARKTEVARAILDECRKATT